MGTGLWGAVFSACPSMLGAVSRWGGALPSWAFCPAGKMALSRWSGARGPLPGGLARGSCPVSWLEAGALLRKTGGWEPPGVAGVRGPGVKWVRRGVGGHAASSEHLDSVQAPWKAKSESSAGQGCGSVGFGRMALETSCWSTGQRTAVAGPGGAGFVTD